MKFNTKKAVYLIVLLLLLISSGIFMYLNYWKPGESTLPAGMETTKVARDTISTTIGSTGKVRPNQIVNLTWQTSGTVGQVHVKNLDYVKSGDVLLELDEKTLTPAILQAYEDLPAAQRALDLLYESDVKRTQARETLAQAQINYQNAKEAREIKNQRNTSDTNLLDAEATYLQAKANLESVENFFSFLQDRPEDDLARAQATAQLSMARKNYNWALWNYQWAQQKPLPEDIRQADADLKLAEAKLADAQRDWEKVKDKPDPDDISSAKANVEALQSQISLTKIIAPISGKVVDSRFLVGDMVKSGQQAITLMDDNRMFLDISVSEVDINNVKVGKGVVFSFDAIPEKTYSGKVTEISRVGVSDQEVIYYTVSCEINNPDESIRAGMTAAATIDVDRASDVIAIPNNALLVSNGDYSVLVVRDNQLKKVPVELGLVSDLYSELKSGDLNEGELLVTNPRIIPTSEIIK